MPDAQLEIFTLLVNVPIYTAPGIFPLMQNLSAAGIGGDNAKFVRQVPYRLSGFTIDSSLATATGLIGVCVVKGQAIPQVGYSQNLEVLATHQTLLTTTISRTTYVQCGPHGILIPAGHPITLFGFTSSPMGVGDVIYCAVSLYMRRDE